MDAIMYNATDVVAAASSHGSITDVAQDRSIHGDDTVAAEQRRRENDDATNLYLALDDVLNKFQTIKREYRNLIDRLNQWANYFRSESSHGYVAQDRSIHGDDTVAAEQRRRENDDTTNLYLALDDVLNKFRTIKREYRNLIDRLNQWANSQPHTKRKIFEAGGLTMFTVWFWGR